MRQHTQLIFAVLPILPLIAALLLLDAIYSNQLYLQDKPVEYAFIAGELREIRFFNALITYASVGLFHLASCLVAMVFLVLSIRSFSGHVQRNMWLIVGILLGLLLLSNFSVRGQHDPGALNLSYRNICVVLTQAEVASSMMPGACSDPGLSTLDWMATLLYGAGVLVAIFAAALASAAAAPLPDVAKPAGVAEFKRRARTLEKGFQVTSFVLVTSTISMALFYQLPLTVVQDENTAAVLKGYAQGMTMFWGVVCTLTLMVSFLPAALMMHSAAQAQTGLHAEAQVVESVIGDANYLSARRQFSSVLTVLAPLLVGSSGTILDLIVESV